MTVLNRLTATSPAIPVAENDLFNEGSIPGTSDEASPQRSPSPLPSTSSGESFPMVTPGSSPDHEVLRDPDLIAAKGAQTHSNDRVIKRRPRRTMFGRFSRLVVKTGPVYSASKSCPCVL